MKLVSCALHAGNPSSIDSSAPKATEYIVEGATMSNLLLVAMVVMKSSGQVGCFSGFYKFKHQRLYAPTLNDVLTLKFVIILITQFSCGKLNTDHFFGIIVNLFMKSSKGYCCRNDWNFF